MKNIHILPTPNNKPTKSSIWSKETASWSNIYITSDEPIREGDWFITIDTNEIDKSDWIKFPFYNGKKIILTTDQDLIKDGVQAIDYEFLQWFVKNPSCEEVEVELIEDSENHPELVGNPIEKWSYYTIIIPQEETLPQFGTKEFVNMCENIFGGKPKQETLEEAKLRIYKDHWNVEHTQWIKSNFLNGFEAGAKWQQERSYSETEVLQLLLRLQQTESYNNLYDWFKQFKKK